MGMARAITLNSSSPTTELISLQATHDLKHSTVNVRQRKRTHSEEGVCKVQPLSSVALGIMEAHIHTNVSGGP